MATHALKSLSGPQHRDRHVFVVCTGDSCRVAGAEGVLQELKQCCRHASGDLRVGAAKCIGHCQLAPAMVEDGRVLGAVSTRRVKAELTRLGLLD
ncbi:MAG: NAD(P)H-dependent oxidoreductase subunit E [Candidatus Solibacter usitatus]|nr:NAD(P)H-dependent oxidoreductase subunit E [Candidatus Solibacter usitatus]